MNWTDIKVGQVWRSKDTRDHGATRTVVEAPTGQMTFVVMDSGCRKSRVRPGTLLARYELVSNPNAGDRNG